MERVFIIGTGLIGASTGLALRAAGFAGRIDGWDASSLGMAAAVQMGAIDGRASNRDDALELARLAEGGGVGGAGRWVERRGAAAAAGVGGGGRWWQGWGPGG